jgi:hypothetical protein
MIVLAVACTETTTGLGQGKGTEDTSDADADVDADSDADADDGDLDNDGFTVADGDCDDADVHVSPARDEEADGVDNDCDGRVDEAWAGLTVGWTDGDGAGSLVVLDTLGDRSDLIELGAVAPYFVASGGDAGWYVSVDFTTVLLVDPDGTTTTVGDFSDTDAYANGVWGVAAGPDGTAYASTADSLVALDGAGGVAALAAWSSDEFYAVNLAVDPLTGVVAVFDYSGGMATWDGASLTTLVEPDPERFASYSGAHRDGDTWYILTYDASLAAYAVEGYDGAGGWTAVETWTSTSWTPYFLAINGDDRDDPDFYASADASGVYPTVWRLVGGYAADFYLLEGAQGYFWGVASNG